MSPKPPCSNIIIVCRTTTLLFVLFFPLHCFARATTLVELFSTFWRHYYVLIIAIGVLMLLLPLLFTYFYLKERRMMHERQKLLQQQLLVAESSIRKYEQHLQTIREDERKSISRELHDHLGQLLTALRIQMFRHARQTSLTELPQLHGGNVEIQELIVEIDNVIQTVRQISKGLRSTDLKDVGLLKAIEAYVKKFQAKTSINCQYLSNIESISMNKTYEIDVYRIFQESLTNIARHARASQVVISIARESAFYLMTVADNGIGIVDTEIQQLISLGIQGMKERTALFGGEISINNNPGNGTLIVLQIPIV